jgi:hypothetical protein
VLRPNCTVGSATTSSIPGAAPRYNRSDYRDGAH